MRDDQTPPISEIAVQRFTKFVWSIVSGILAAQKRERLDCPHSKWRHGPLHHMRKRSNIKGPEVYEWHDPNEPNWKGDSCRHTPQKPKYAFHSVPQEQQYCEAVSAPNRLPQILPGQIWAFPRHARPPC